MSQTQDNKSRQAQDTPFTEQGGAATMDPSSMLRWITSTVVRRVASEKQLLKQRKQAERQRLKANEPHVVEYFHQVDDGYSHLAAQLLQPMLQQYDIELRCHLVSGPSGDNSVEPELLIQLSAYDAQHIAPHYGLSFPTLTASSGAASTQFLIQTATAILAAQDNKQFIARAANIGNALWLNDTQALQSMADEFGLASDEQVQASIAKGNARREALQHYSGAMFYYGGEWYWGVDRLYHLEQRLLELGAKNTGAKAITAKPSALIAPRPTTSLGDLKDNGSLTFEIYPSLRSPYTAIIFDRAVKLAQDTGVNLVVRPVLPMVMRGVPATREKGMYIFKDAAREARAAHVPFGNFYDPIGEPVRRCYSLYPWAVAQGKGIELISAFLNAAFNLRINTNRDRGLQQVVEAAGLDWQQAKLHLGNNKWQALLETNRLAMYDAGLWGVPSFRLLDKNGDQALALWGQDRLWLFAEKIQQLLAEGV